MEITADFIKNSELVHEGTTCFIMRHESNVTYKIYKKTMDYILNGGDYQLDEKETFDRLNYLVSKKNDVHLTDLPSDFLTFQGKAVGVLLVYYKNTVDLRTFLKEKPDIDRDSIKQKLLDIVGELIENGIVPTDPHFENFLVCYHEDGSYDIKMIDSDDFYISIYPDNKRDIWYDSEVAACYRVLDLSFEEIHNSKMSNF